MRQSFKVSFYLRSNYENKEGKSPVMLRIFLGGVPWDKLLVATRGQEAHRDRTDELSYMLVDRTPIGEEATIPCIA